MILQLQLSSPEHSSQLLARWDLFQFDYRYSIGTGFGVAGVFTQIGFDLHLAKA